MFCFFSFGIIALFLVCTCYSAVEDLGPGPLYFGEKKKEKNTGRKGSKVTRTLSKPPHPPASLSSRSGFATVLYTIPFSHGRDDSDLY